MDRLQCRSGTRQLDATELITSSQTPTAERHTLRDDRAEGFGEGLQRKLACVSDTVQWNERSTEEMLTSPLQQEYLMTASLVNYTSPC